MENNETAALDFGSIDFTPDWARKDAGVVVGRTSAPRGRDDAHGRDGRRDGGSFRPGGGRDAAQGRDGRPRPQGGRFQKGGRDGRDGFGRSQGRPAPARPQTFFDVKVLPEPKALGTVIRKLQSDFHAYKLKDLAHFLLDNPPSVMLKISPRVPEGAAGEAPALHQCKACGFVATDAAEMAAHAVQAHLADYYDVRETECEPPKGNFPCVARCGLSGVLLGPPNIHEFNSIVRETVRTRYPGMTESEYRSHIEMVRDPEVVEEWRKGAVKKTVYLPKGAAEDAAPLAREQAEAEFRRTIAPSLTEIRRTAMATADVALASPLPSLRRAAAEALEAERRAPVAMCFALRGAFHHRKMHFFRANDARGQEFVAGVEYKAFDAQHAIPELAAVAGFVASHPCANAQEIAPDPETRKHLDWLVTTGHVVAFTNGVHSAVEKFPKYGPQWRKTWAAKAKEEPKPETSAPEAVPEAPVPEAVPEPVPELAPQSAQEPAPETPAPEQPLQGTAPEAAPATQTTEKEVTENETPAQLAE